jgi:hypothetical protein
MRYRPSSSLSYRNVLIAAGLAAGLGVGTACAEPADGVAAQPHSGGGLSRGTLADPAQSHYQALEAEIPPAHQRPLPRGSGR